MKAEYRKGISKWFLWIIFIFLTPRLFAYYDSLQGRFLSPDPGGYEASLGLNDYGSGDPVNQLDSDGRFVRPVLDLADQYQAGTRFVGTLQLAGGTAMAVVGTPMLGTPAFPLGAALIGLGGDQAQAGLRTMLYGQPSESFLYQGSEALGMSPYQARIFEGGMTLAGGYSGLRGAALGVETMTLRVESLDELAILPFSEKDEVVKRAVKALVEIRGDSVISQSGLAFLKSGDDTLTIVAHGNHRYVYNGDVPYTAEQLANTLILNGVKNSGITRIELVSCQAGSRGYAQELANRLNITVLAPRGNMTIVKGFYGVPQRTIETEGYYEILDPVRFPPFQKFEPK